LARPQSVDWLGDMEEITRQQIEICKKYRAEYSPLDWSLNVGESINLYSGELPINGLRISLAGTTGWFLWAGKEFSQAPDFFRPVHALHLLEKLPEVIPYLGLSLYWRFLIAPGYEDVWYDERLKNY
jgi:hypothetical protein